MRRRFIALLSLIFTASAAHAQIGVPGVQYSTSIAAGEGGQMYSYDRQDPWLHGQFQRVPAYGGFASFRPYNYRHVFSQTQIASGWGAPHGMPYSQQFWNKYRGSYLQGNLHSGMSASIQSPADGQLIDQASYAPRQNVPQSTTVPGSTTVAGFGYPTGPGTPSADQRPVHIFPSGMQPR